jgi:16S rRNA (uracil1498-N3)-methyltransferase
MPMSRRRFFISRDQIRDASVLLTPDQAHHLHDVLRLRAGAEVELFDGEGRCYSGKVECCGAEIRIAALQRLESSDVRGSALILAAALIKADRFEWMLQKGTELGVDRFIPLETRFSVVHIPPARLASRMQRWQRIVLEASKQSRRSAVPAISRPLSWGDFLAEPESAGGARFLLHEKAAEPIPTAPWQTDRLLLCVGPEGGWDPSEAAAAENAGFRLVNMGSKILRAETAALAAIAIFQFLLDRRPKT